MDRRKIFKVTTIVLVVVTVICALWIMIRGLGLADGYDFGAGAYYYADIPEYEKVVKDDVYSTSVPYWVHALLFLGWGAFMYWLWKRLDR
ncbi:MAG: hypothetical protein IK143_00060 [Bacteroidales bacterium]|nr:hypothetical protein [Bacteroidales bacterium]